MARAASLTNVLTISLSESKASDDLSLKILPFASASKSASEVGSKYSSPSLAMESIPFPSPVSQAAIPTLGAVEQNVVLPVPDKPYISTLSLNFAGSINDLVFLISNDKGFLTGGILWCGG